MITANPRNHGRTHEIALLIVGLFLIAANATAGSILFIGNSFTYAHGSPVRYYRAETVTDLNSIGIGGMPALFKSFTSQAGLDYDVYLEIEPGVGVDWHLANRLGVIGKRPFDTVVMHGFSTLDAKKPGDPALLVSTVRQMADPEGKKSCRRFASDGHLATRRPDLPTHRAMVRQEH